MFRDINIYSLFATIILLLIITFLYFFELIEHKYFILCFGFILLIHIALIARILYFFNTRTPEKNQELIALKTAEKYRREFFGNVSHELKTPIFNIQGYVETLINGALYDKTVNKKYLKRTIKSIDRLIYIIQDLETISQLESEELKLEITDWKLKNVIDDIIDQFEIKSEQKKIKFLHDKKSTNLNVVGDKDKITQVLINLISNSIKYGKRGGFIKIGCHQVKSKCLISIRDNGIGISEKNIPRLFERFYRVDKSRSREQGGTGLGLAIVKHIVEAHGEDINVQSKVGKGTEFTFSINSVN